MFNSIHFLIFFPTVIILYFSIKHKYRWIVLLASSYYFYMSWKPEYVILIMISTLVDYFAALFMSKTDRINKRKLFLILSLCSNLGLLFSFKYFNFVSGSVADFLKIFSIQFTPLELSVLLPIGISFYTFQSLGYTIDVYKGKIKPEKHLGIFALYVSFFPQLVAGPIERAKNLLPQFFEKHNFEYERAANGLKLMLWGFFKKIVIADNLAIVVNQVYNNVGEYEGTPLILATVLFAFQIYCDFSGYSDIAIGSAEIMGFRLMNNFKRPYFSKSILEFWRRWHISLSTWFRDYLYIPLGGNRVPKLRLYSNLFIVFILSGLWHGANWTFVIWGLLHGFYMIFSIISENKREKFVRKIGLKRLPKIHSIIQIAITFALVNLGWIFFRANSLSDAAYIITHLFSGFTLNIEEMNIGIGLIGMIMVISSILFLVCIHLLQVHTKIRQFISKKPIWQRWLIYFTIIFVILLFGISEGIPFIYFQF